MGEGVIRSDARKVGIGVEVLLPGLFRKFSLRRSKRVRNRVLSKYSDYKWVAEVTFRCKEWTYIIKSLPSETSPTISNQAKPNQTQFILIFNDYNLIKIYPFFLMRKHIYVLTKFSLLASHPWWSNPSYLRSLVLSFGPFFRHKASLNRHFLSFSVYKIIYWIRALMYVCWSVE